MATPMAEDSNFEDDQLHAMSTEDIIRASRLLDNEIRIIKVPISLYLPYAQLSWAILCFLNVLFCLFVSNFGIYRVDWLIDLNGEL